MKFSVLIGSTLLALALAACGNDVVQPSLAPTPTSVPVVTAAATASSTAEPAPPQAKVDIPTPPDRDLVALARRFRPGETAGLAQPPVLEAADVGRVDRFWLVDLAGPSIGQVNATLRLVTPHAAWYIGEDVSVSTSDLEAAAAVFEDQVYPQVTEAVLGFVPQPSASGPGARITMLNTRLSGAAGYFGAVDFYSPGVYPYSNGRPMLYLEAGALSSRGRAYASLLAHELQHLLHFHLDPTEETWVNEGLSEAVSELVAPGSSISPPGGRREVSLTRWPDHTVGLGSYYATANLFFRYLTARYRDVDGLSRLIARPEDGIDGVDAFLAEAGRTESFASVFQDWAVANLLGEDGTGVYSYGENARVNAVTAPRSLSLGDALEGSVVPFAADYVTLELPSGLATLRFQGQLTTSIIPTEPYSGASCWWSNRGDSTHTRLSREIDLSDVTQATLQFRVWHNLESPWDFLYVTASRDGGATWDILPGVHTLEDNPVGTSYGPGLTGDSGVWIQETMDLSPYAGGRVTLAFEQVSDDAINLDGACIDDVEVPEIGLFDDAETDGLWAAEGFVRTDNVLPQRFGVRIVIVGDNGVVNVQEMELDGANTGTIQIDVAADEVQSATVIVSSLTRHTGQAATYILTLDEGIQ